jgi:hypothetical protein
MNENQSQTESLLDIVRSIKTETLLLPEFQRETLLSIKNGRSTSA